MKKRCIFLLLILFSCQPVEIIEPVVFDNSQLKTIKIIAESKEIKNLYETKIADLYIDHLLVISPAQRIETWIKENIKTIGNENNLIINILDASLKRSEITNKDAKNFDEKIIYKYELFFLVEYTLFDSSDLLLATTTVESFRSTTSGKYISLQATDQIINDLILLNLKDFTEESKKLLAVYMQNYIS